MCATGHKTTERRTPSRLEQRLPAATTRACWAAIPFGGVVTRNFYPPVSVVLSRRPVHEPLPFHVALRLVPATRQVADRPLSHRHPLDDRHLPALPRTREAAPRDQT